MIVGLETLDLEFCEILRLFSWQISSDNLCVSAYVVFLVFFDYCEFYYRCSWLPGNTRFCNELLFVELTATEPTRFNFS